MGVGTMRREGDGKWKRRKRRKLGAAIARGLNGLVDGSGSVVVGGPVLEPAVVVGAPSCLSVQRASSSFDI